MDNFTAKSSIVLKQLYRYQKQRCYTTLKFKSTSYSVKHPLKSQGCLATHVAKKQIQNCKRSRIQFIPLEGCAKANYLKKCIHVSQSTSQPPSTITCHYSIIIVIILISSSSSCRSNELSIFLFFYRPEWEGDRNPWLLSTIWRIVTNPFSIV